jgi:hypothetical protein
MSDNTEAARRDMIAAGQPAADLAAEKGRTWDTDKLQRDFEVTGFAAPFVVVRRRSDGAVGSLEFTHSPRLYFSWRKDEPR